MKNFFLMTGLCFFITLTMFCQPYVPFPTENASWHVFYAGTCTENKPVDSMLIRYHIHGDTVINDTHYSKLYIQTGDTTNPSTMGIGGIREESKKIYYIGPTILGGGNDDEYLLYDFTVKIGDTIYHNSNSNFYSEILGIDSVLINDHYRKRYEVNNHWYYHNPDYIVEGIGSVKNGLLGHISDLTTCGTHFWEHICFIENGKEIFLNPVFDDCYPYRLIESIKEIKSENILEVKPNPFRNEIEIGIKIINPDLTFKLIDINGKVLLEKKIYENLTKTNVNVTSGIYNALIINKKGGILMSKKIIKE